jgi:general secretion pathway protein M
MDALREYWVGQTQKDRNTLIVTFFVIGLFFFYSEVITPTNEYRQKAIQDRDYWYKTQLYILENEQSARSIAINQNDSNSAQNSESVRVIISQLAEAHRVSLSRIEPSNNSIGVWVDQTNFKSGLSWLQAITKQRNIKIKSLNVSKLQFEGKVGLRVEFYL